METTTRVSNGEDGTTSGFSVDTISMVDFLGTYGKAIKDKVRSSLLPLFQKGALDDFDQRSLDKQHLLMRKPYVAQATTISAISKGLYKEDKRSIILTGEMGSGKTLMGIGVAMQIPKRNSRIVIICPTHLQSKWEREIKETDEKASVVKTLNSISDISLEKPYGREYWIISKERAKLHYQKRLALVCRQEHGNVFYRCPDCGKVIDEEMLAEQSFCECGSSFYSADNTKLARYSLAEFIKRHKKYCRIDLLIADEVHELKGGDTAQGQALHALAVSSRKILAMTGTLMGGYAEDLYYLLFRLFTRKMVQLGYKHNSSSDFTKNYGVYEIAETTKTASRTSSLGYGKTTKNTRKRPGISPLLLPHFLLEDAIYVWISDISDQLPSYQENIELVDMTEEQREVYKSFESELMSAVVAAMRFGQNKLLGAMVNSLYSLPDGARRGETVYTPSKVADIDSDLQVAAHAEALDIPILPKEARLIELILEEKRQGRKSAIFLENTGEKRDLRQDIVERLEENGIKTLVLDASIQAVKREAWLSKHIKEDRPDVLICNPNLVKTGLDLLDFPTIIYFQTGMSIFTLRQSSRRSWRIGQDKPVKVYFMAYRDTAQERALKLIATKLETSNAVEGKLSEDGLTAISSGGESSMVIAMARSLLGEDKEKRSLTSIWQGYQASEKSKEQTLVDRQGYDEAFNYFLIRDKVKAQEPVRVVISEPIVEQVDVKEVVEEPIKVATTIEDEVLLKAAELATKRGQSDAKHSRRNPLGQQLSVMDFLDAFEAVGVA